jgi:glyoxylase-like metal-dependent hydrolase (beta-lactamase superfamily II)
LTNGKAARDANKNKGGCVMKHLLPGIWQWSWFSQEKQLDFNGLYIELDGQAVVVDPPPLTDDARAVIRRRGTVDALLITNRDHVREADACRREFGGRLLVPARDAVAIEIAPDATYRDGERLPCGLLVVGLSDQKSPGESAFLLMRGRGVLIVGDALIGKPPGGVSMLPADKYANEAKAKESLRRLLQYEFDSLLVGDGVSILTGAKGIVQRFLQGAP